MSQDDLQFEVQNSENEQVLAFDEPYDTAEQRNEECEGNTSSEIMLNDKPKILIQRIFHQPEKNVLAQKLDYVIADSQEEITKHVYGGLFRTRYYDYAPHRYCQNHAPDLLEHSDETFLKLGDKFESIECFRFYVDSHAKQWKYYLKCFDSHRKNGRASFVFSCTFRKPKKKYFQSKGMRKRTTNDAIGNDCPCRVVLKAVPFGSNNLTVIYVCNHHTHPLTDEHFQQLQHGRRLHPDVKEELMDLLSLDVHKIIVKKYLESLTGYSMNTCFFNNIYYTMRKNKIARNFSVDKLKEMSRKIEKIKEDLGIHDPEENVDNDLLSEDHSIKDKASQVAEVFNVLKAVSTTKKTKKRKKQRNPEMGPTPVRKRNKRRHEEDPTLPQPQRVISKSRLETRLQELKHDHDTLQSIKHLQDSVRCETERNPWVHEMESVVPHKRTPLGNKPRRMKKQVEIIEPNTETQRIVVEHIETNEEHVENHIEHHVENQDIFYENEISVMDTKIIEYDDGNNVVKKNDQELAQGDELSYCIQYEDENQCADQQEEHYVLLLDDVETFENLPEVQIQATELATVSIVSGNNQQDIPVEPTTVQDEASHGSFTNGDNAVDGNEDIHEPSKLCVEKGEKEMPDVDDLIPEAQESMVFEVIQSNDSKIFPSREVVRTVILNKEPTRTKNSKKSIKPKLESNEEKYSKNKSLFNERFHKTKQSNVDKADDILQYFKEELSRNQFQDLREKMSPTLEVKAEDDDYYMIIVKDDGDRQSCDEAGSYDELEDNDYKNVKLEVDLNASSSMSTIDRFDGKIEVEPFIEKTYEHKGIQCNVDESEMIYKNDIARLKRQKFFLEKDIQNLIETKDNLIDDVIRSKKYRRYV